MFSLHSGQEPLSALKKKLLIIGDFSFTSRKSNKPEPFQQASFFPLKACWLVKAFCKSLSTQTELNPGSLWNCAPFSHHIQPSQQLSRPGISQWGERHWSMVGDLLTLWESPFAVLPIGESSVWARPTDSQPCPKLATKSETRQQTSSLNRYWISSASSKLSSSSWNTLLGGGAHMYKAYFCLFTWNTHFSPHFVGYSLGLYVMGEEKSPSLLPLPPAPSQHPLSLASSVKSNSCNPLNHFS